MGQLVSVRRAGEKFACFLAGRKVKEVDSRDAALEWASKELREGRALSRHSIVSGSDVAAHRADQAGRAVMVDGAEWRFA